MFAHDCFNPKKNEHAPRGGVTYTIAGPDLCQRGGAERARKSPPHPGPSVVPRDNGVIYGIKSWAPARRDESFGLLTTCQRRARRRPLSVLGGV